MKINQMLIPDNVKPKFTVNGKKVTFPMVPEYITIHETANTAKGANDLAHANLQKNGNSRNASWHLQVDDDSCYQSLSFNEAALHAGDGVNGNGNRKSIGIEICVNSDGDFEKAIRNAANVTAQLMIKFNIPSHKVVTHKHWSGKNCPANLLKGRWQEFINLCIAERGKLLNPKAERKMTGMKPNWADWQWEEAAELFQKAYDKGIFSDKKWVDKAKAKDLTFDELEFLNLALNRDKLK